MEKEANNQNALNVKPALSQGLTPGRIVHYVLPAGFRYKGEHRPAIVVKVWPYSAGADQYPLIQLQVFLDGANDGREFRDNSLYWATSVHYSEEKEPGTWHWIEKA
jgi:hypothetical protein